MPEKEQQNTNPDQQNQVLFMMLVQQHQQIGMMGLGEEENPGTGRKEKDLKTVKYAIDTLNMLEKYTSGNLSDEMSNYLKETIKALQMKYVNASGSQGGGKNN